MLPRSTSPASCRRSSALGRAWSLTPLGSGGGTRSWMLAAGPACSPARPFGGPASMVRLLASTLNAGMLAVAARTEPNVEWRQGDAASLPFEDASFDVVVSQFALMYFPDRVAFLREMWRTLAPGDALPSPPGRRSITPAATSSWWTSPSGNADVRQPTCWQRRSSLAIRPSSPSSLPTAASRGQDHLHEGSIRFPSVQEFIRIEVKGSPLAGMLSDDAMRALAAESEDALAEFVVPSGEIVMPMDAHILTASKG